MKTWSDVLNYSVGLAAMLVLTICATAVLSVIGVAVIIAKLWMFIK